ncbi:TPA: single-stranded DNA-binding protein [Clostridium perfringens]|nr:single-stranded DNA-binding protein [Clostridium perfringens]HBI6993145.1 single-stranded DNA-binding protein [Clostridium perfringens]HBI6999163.1 single-stranded DNA-binding protein [Clostridium perfringens]HBI7025823.1 single-stranded DNA-binding protein [Clostridium perfringens]HBI7059273.1 single-stranded DNA-binding protein [Clostridium perfringens]
MNKVVLIGRLTKDPELRFAAGSGTAVTRFTLAVSRPFKKDETDFINCIAFGKAGETIAQYVTKGQQFAISGNIRTGSYEAQDGTRRYTTDVVVEGFDFISGNSNVNNQKSREDADKELNDALMEGIDDGDIPF